MGGHHCGGTGLRTAQLLLAAFLSACGLQFNPQSQGGTGNPGGGGGPRGPGGTGAPLDMTPEFTVRNELAVERTETFQASVPFPQGAHASTDGLGVSGIQTAWRVLQRWADGTIRVAQAHFTDTLPANTLRTYRVVQGVQPLTGPFQRNDWVNLLSAGLSYGAEVKDTFGVPYRAIVAGPGDTLVSTPLVEVKRYRMYHYAANGGIGRDYLCSMYYVTEFRDVPVVVVDWVLCNDYQGSDSAGGSPDPNLHPLGGVDVREARFLVRGTLPLPYRPAQEAIEPAEQQPDGYTGFRVMNNTWLDDAQCRRYRFVLAMIHPAANPVDQQRWLDTANGMVQLPMLPLGTQNTWYMTQGLGLLGGPLAGPADSGARAEGEYNFFNSGNWFGTWGSRGDAKATGTTGTPRNSPLSPDLGHAVQANHHRLLIALEQKAWAQAMRPYHLWALQIGDEQDILLWDGVPIYPGSRDLSHESLGRRALYGNDPYRAYRTMVNPGDRAHGWEHFDNEHWSTDLLFDYWTLTGDCWAQEELRQLGQSLKGLMRCTIYGTQFTQAVRSEGWTMQGFAQVYQATGDENIKQYALRRVHQIVDPQRMRNHPSRAMGFQENYEGTGWPMPHKFYMPWQHGAVLYGYLGANRFFRDAVMEQICEDVVPCVEYAWVTNYQDPQYGLVANGLRYYVPVEFNGAPVAPNFFDASAGVHWGDSPLGGAHTFLIGGLLLLSEATADNGLSQRALQYGSLLRGPGLTDYDRWDKWHYVLTENFAP